MSVQAQANVLGRKPGTGQFIYRKPPSADEVTEPVVAVPVLGDTCPGCGGVLEHEGVRLAYVTDLPPVPRPQVTAYRVQVCRCRSCGKAVRGRHPDIAPDQYGASAHRVGKRLHGGGPRAPSMEQWAFRANHCRSQSARSHGVLVELNGSDQSRTRCGCQGSWVMPSRKLRTSVRASQVVHIDATGWSRGRRAQLFLHGVRPGPQSSQPLLGDMPSTGPSLRHQNALRLLPELVPSDYGLGDGD